MAIKPARIDSDGKVITADRRIHLSKRFDDEIQWTSQGQSGPWTVVFTNVSPFSSTTFTVPVNGNVRSGLPVVEQSATEYKYDVREGDRITDDPEVLIEF